MFFLRRSVIATLTILALLAGAGSLVLAQRGEGGSETGVSTDSSSNFEVTGITVDVTGEDAFDAQRKGWEEAQRQGWRMLYARMTGGSASGAPALSDSALDGIVSGIIIEEEQIGPTRYVARLGVMFDRARVSQYLGSRGQVSRSPPLLTVPVMWIGNTPQSFEERNAWMRAWVRFRTGDSSIDYVRAAATNPTPLLLTVGQTQRPGRGWWRFLLDSYGAADVIIPVVHLRYSYPGGPVTGTFIGYHGPDRRKLGQFSLRVRNADSLDRLLDAGVQRMDQLFRQALADGRLTPDPSLQFEFGIDEEELEDEFEEMEASIADRTPPEAVNDEQATATGRYTIQVATPNADAVRSSEAAVRGTPGVRAATTSSLAIGGLSLMEVTYIGDLDALASALAARGFQVQRGAGTLRISRAAPPPQPTPQQPPAQEGGGSEDE